MDRRSYNKILLVRTDRLGDVVLSTPCIKAVRQAYPDTHIAMMIQPYTEAVVTGNPYLDEVIVYDKYKKHKSWLSSIFFALSLRRKHFDAAIILHPTNRTHILIWLAGIRKRVGYKKNFSFLLTDKIEDIKRLGLKHEVYYNLDMLKFLGIETREPELYLPLDKGYREKIDALLKPYGINSEDNIITLHPGASCISKRWPSPNFAKLADSLAKNYKFKIVFVAGTGKTNRSCLKSIESDMSEKGVFLSGVLSVPELAGLLKRSTIFISNDSGPAHIAAALKVKEVVIFGRANKGLGPVRWGPFGTESIILHKNVGCSTACLAHACRRDFRCLKEIKVDDVLSAVKTLLN